MGWFEVFGFMRLEGFMSEFNIFIATIIGVISFVIGAVRIVRMMIEDKTGDGEVKALRRDVDKLEKRMEKYELYSYRDSGNLIKQLVDELKEK